MDYSTIENTIKEMIEEEPLKIVFSNPRNKSGQDYKKIVVVPKIIKDNLCFQFEKFTDKQAFHENISSFDLLNRLVLLTSLYKQVNGVTKNGEWEIKFNKKLDYIVNRRIVNTMSEPKMKPIGNNRKKDYILKEGMNIPVFKELGIFTSEYKVVNSKYDKFKQINRFTELLSDMLKDYKKKDIGIIDFGCGKSYLTFVVYYYLKEIKGIEPHIIGLDLKADVIERCNDLAKTYGYSGLRFELGDINGYKADFKVDMVITLHACDTATDYALFNAISWNADMILSVPCCQHEINKQIKTERLAALTKYGIVKERISALITDSIRGCMLEYKGYKTDLIEFIDIEHSPKNIMIRAKKCNISSDKRSKSLEEALAIREEFGVDQTLMKLLLGDEITDDTNTNNKI